MSFESQGKRFNLFGTAVKFEKTYRAIMSRQVSVSSKWRFFRLSSAWAIEFSSADPRLELVMDVWIRLETGGLEFCQKGTPSGEKVKQAVTKLS